LLLLLCMIARNLPILHVQWVGLCSGRKHRYHKEKHRSSIRRY
jgi:hypothetical protein